MGKIEKLITISLETALIASNLNKANRLKVVGTLVGSKLLFYIRKVFPASGYIRILQANKVNKLIIPSSVTFKFFFIKIFSSHLKKYYYKTLPLKVYLMIRCLYNTHNFKDLFKFLQMRILNQRFILYK